MLNILLRKVDMQQFIERPKLLTAAIGGLSEAPVVALLGARQVGKTTLAERGGGRLVRTIHDPRSGGCDYQGSTFPYSRETAEHE